MQTGAEGNGVGHGRVGKTTELPAQMPGALPVQRVIDALEVSYLDDERSDQLFAELMSKMAADRERRRKLGRLVRVVGLGVGTLVATVVVGFGAVRLLGGF